MIYSWKKYGLISASNYSTGLLEFSKELEGEGLCNYFKSVVYGRLAYISMVRGRDAVLLNLVKPIPELDSKCPEYIKQICDMNEEYDVFIGHASEDKVIARELTASLKGLGLKVFLDENELKWGDSLTEKINFSLSKSKTFLAMMSEDSIKKKWPKKEVNAALNREIQGRQIFLPLIIGDTNKILEKYPLIEEKFYQKWEDNAQDLADLINELLSNNNDLGEQN